MEPLFVLITLIVILVVFLTVVTLVGHAIWLIVAAIIKSFSRTANASEPPSARPSLCPNCHAQMGNEAVVCFVCGVVKPSGITVELLKDLAATARQLERFHRSGAVGSSLYETLKANIENERLRLLARAGPEKSSGESAVSPSPEPSVPSAVRTQPASVTESLPQQLDIPPPATPPSVVVTSVEAISVAPTHISAISVVEMTPLSDNGEQRQVDPPRRVTPPSPPRKPFTEVIAAFMEESNIRWGEIIGGLLIIGCSTALVVSLWTAISSIPVLKFLIFTTVTAALFGVGLYTEHRWKLPTTSRGILTTATLLVPLNFLAIAAVSGGTSPPDVLLIISELVAPAVFLCLVYFAGRVLTPEWPHLLTAGVLGSSIGQLLVRHFAAPDVSHTLLVALGAFPVICYVGSTAWMLRQTLARREIREQDTTSIFITLGALTFAAALPFGLLLYKGGPIGMSMMYLAPLVSLGGLPALAMGTILWRRISKRELLVHRMAGTTLAIIGTLSVLLGMILAWPNPASIVPAALLNFAVFTALAVWLEIPVGHFVASLCFGLAYIVLFHVMSRHVSWENLRVTSLLGVAISISSGQALSLLFVLFLAASEWLAGKRRGLDSNAYLSAAVLVGILSLLLVSVFGLGINGDPKAVSFVFALYAVGAFWIAWRRRPVAFSWIGSALLLAALAQTCAKWLDLQFPWQTAFLVHTSISAIAAIVSSHYEKNTEHFLAKTLNQSALISSFVVVLCLVQAGPWEATALQAESVLWLSSVWLCLLWLNRQRGLLSLFQIALTCGVVISIKAMLQQYDWYAYLPHAFMHPWSLQIQGTALVLIGLAWSTLRFWTKKASEHRTANEEHGWITDAWRLLNAPYAFDRIVSWLVLAGFVCLAVYGAWSGLAQELTSAETQTHVWNVAGFPHEQAFGPGSWILLGLLTTLMLVNFRERARYIYCLGAVAAVTTIAPLLAGRWETELATASAWRWIAAGFLVLASVPLWFRDRLGKQFKLQTVADGIDGGELARLLRAVLLISTLVPLFVLTGYPALRAVYYMPVHGPSSGIFFLLDNPVLYGVPLVTAALVLIGYAVRDRLPIYAFAGGLFFNIAATMIYLFSVVAVHGSMNRVVVAHVIQLNGIVSALYALVWLAMRKKWIARLEPARTLEAKRILGIQIAICLAANVLVMLPVAMRLLMRPDLAGMGTFESGNAGGWLAFLLTLIAAGWFARANAKHFKPGHLFATLLGATCLLSFAASRWDVGNWTGFHTLIIGSVLTASFLVLARSAPSWLTQSRVQLFGLHLAGDWEWDCALFATIGGILTAFLSFRARLGEPSTAWWSIAPLLAMTTVAAVLHWQVLKRSYLYAAGMLFSSAGVIWWRMQFPLSASGRSVEIIVIALCISSIVWLAFELRARKATRFNGSTALSLHNLAAVGSLIVIGCFCLLRLTLSALELPLPSPGWLDWPSIISITALLFACLWDERAKHSLPAIYLAALLMIYLGLDQLALAAHSMAWAGTLSLAIFGFGANVVWRWREQIMLWTDRVKIPRRIEPTVTSLKWLTVFSIALVTIVGLFAYWIDLTFFDWTLRMTAALAVVVQAMTFALLAEGRTRARWQRAAVGVFLLGMVLLGWSWLTPGLGGTWLNRAVILMVEMFAFTAAYSLGLEKGLQRKPEWTKAVRESVPWVVGAGLVALTFALCTEVFYQINFGAVRINATSLVVVGLTLIAAIVVSVLFALSPKHDPLNLSEKGQMKYVYAAEVILALLFMHVRLTMPWLFTGFFDDYWPFVVMTIAYVGVIASEALRRRDLLVLARPIERTGAFLPLLPVLGFWVAQSRVDYSVLLFLVGGVYGGLSILRRSFAFGLLAAIAGNGGLWYVLHRTQNYGFLQHPQLWLIPVAFSVLIAAYLNREQFSEEQMTSVRYFSLLMVYASSTADIFVNGVADSPWLPLILAALSLCGIFAGISLRIRGLLLLGSVFLLLSIITMIYYASVNLGWTWLWYVAGIVTGATIIFMFAVFEKKRGEVLRVVDGLKEWDS